MRESSVIVVVRREDPCTLDARALLDELSALTALYGAPAASPRFHGKDVQTARSAFVVARTTDGDAIGCGALSRYSFEVAEFSRIYRRPEWPGAGSGILRFLESQAAGMGYRRIVLQTRQENRRAIAFYLRHGYEWIERPCEAGGTSDVRGFRKALAWEKTI